MGIMDLFSSSPVPNYDSIDAVTEQNNLLMMTETKDRQAVIKKMRVGSIVVLKRTKRNGQTVYVVSDHRTGKAIGEISYGTSDYLDANYKGYKMLGKVTEIGRLTPLGKGLEVNIVYKVYL